MECSRPSGGQAVLGRFVEMALAWLFLLLASGGGVGLVGLAPEERYGPVVLEHAFFW